MTAPPEGDPAEILRGRSIALCVSGGIAAYKAVALARLLVQAGASVQPVMTASASKFVGAVTLSGICGRSVIDDMWDPRFQGELHVSVADESDVVVVVPCTADLLARMAHGRADDIVAALALVARGPIIVAPAMHPRMWAHPATQRNAAAVASDRRVRFVGPVVGPVASGDVGMGRMAEPEAILSAIASALADGERRSATLDLGGRHVVVTAGPTVEDVDAVRFIGNRSSGKMGFAVAAAAGARGARVTLVAGPVSLQTPEPPVGAGAIERIDVRSALEMRDALDRVLGRDLANADALVMAAAVGDYRPAAATSSKAKKLTRQEGARMTLELVQNPDLLGDIGARRAGAVRPVLVGFAVETDDLVAHARTKCAAKRVDLVVANLAAHGFAGDDDEVVFVTPTTERALTASKRVIADALLDEVRERLK